MLSAGQEIAGYVLERPIGRGGMAEVWVGRHETSGSLAAVKVLKDTAGPGVRALFDNERRALLRLVHPHIVPVFDVGDDHIVGAFIEGHDLRHRLRTPMDPHDARMIFLSIGSALDYAHRHGVVHCDVKPSNILLDMNGTAFLADFGIARLTDDPDSSARKGSVGTPGYMAPEQVAGVAPTQAADQYALARLIIHMLAGRKPPVMPKRALASLPEGTDPKLIAALSRALSIDPSDRFESTAELLAALLAVDVDTARANAALNPVRRSKAPFGWAAHPDRVERIGAHIVRADYRVSSLVEAGAFGAEAQTFLDETGHADFGWSMYAREENLGPLDAPGSLARAKETVILVHGVFTGRHLWGDISAGIARDNGNVIVLAPDMLGCGASPWADDTDADVTSVPHLVTTLRRWLELIGTSKMLSVVMGHSLSATALLCARAADLPPPIYRIALTPALFAGSFFDTLGMRMNAGLAYMLMAAPKALAKPLARGAFLFERSLWRLRKEVRHAMAHTAIDIGARRVAKLLGAIAAVEAAPPDELETCFVVTTPDDPLVPPELGEKTLKKAAIPAARIFKLLYGGHFPQLADDEHPEFAARNLHEIVSLVDNVLDMAREHLNTADATAATEGPTN